MDAYKLMKELRVNYEQEVFYLPKETGLVLIESSTQDDSRISAKCRDAKVEDLWSLTSFFGYSTQTFVLAVNLLDRFLAMMRIQPKHLSCVSLSCLHMAAKVTEEECNVTSTDELIRIGQCRFTVSDLGRMEKIVSEKLDFKSKAITALTFLQLYHQIALSHSTDRKETLSLEKLEAQLKACLCRISFSKAKPSVLALSLLRQQIAAVQSEDMLEIASHIQRHLKIADGELRLWSERVAQCLSDYASPECSKPNHRKLQWIVSRRTAQNLHTYRSVPELPTIPEGGWDESESEDSCEDVMSSGEESLSSSLGSDAEGPYFPLHYRQQKDREHLVA
ncbi:cyclin-G2 [Hippoglossus hippoglossus]|uniref:cyclin-G2 n=1 Tax=Hippoglossus hippoglossus TaxID=8267 RepID=UPI00148B43C6|nr:cyclin-G2 [Hippoglossus hippoglossus]XP_035039877.1 cyclin-G2 [Hippoglossus stenolepis]XP_035039878.1 cyclin-G2 [Hippoglossus stenolepis]